MVSREMEPGPAPRDGDFKSRITIFDILNFGKQRKEDNLMHLYEWGIERKATVTAIEKEWKGNKYAWVVKCFADTETLRHDYTIPQEILKGEKVSDKIWILVGNHSPLPYNAFFKRNGRLKLPKITEPQYIHRGTPPINN